MKPEQAAAESRYWALNHCAEHLNAGVEFHGYYAMCDLPDALRIEGCRFCERRCVHGGHPGMMRRFWAGWRR